ncbi:hypothetical protein Egran_01459 [Elaphomyces granulatus]|uniref:MARVEL domain-containing protein n=1 Tax=Elaphomyces granulatus TaxID=519963 RepID=A0A232M2Z0_9EURO|nr:hypothetical protein Egran_01459 [Elaphomyces granulatus]
MAISTAMTRPVLLVARVMQWVSSVIVLGLVSYFINKGPSPHGGHLIYEEVIAALSVAFFLPAFVSPFMPHILSKGVLAIDIIFSYLWLTSFIFMAENYDNSYCEFVAPPFFPCSKKRAAQAFTFLAFFFTFLGMFLEVSSLWAYRRENATGTHHEKHGHGATPETSA